MHRHLPPFEMSLALPKSCAMKLRSGSPRNSAAPSSRCAGTTKSSGASAATEPMTAASCPRASA